MAPTAVSKRLEEAWFGWGRAQGRSYSGRELWDSRTLELMGQARGEIRPVLGPPEFLLGPVIWVSKTFSSVTSLRRQLCYQPHSTAQETEATVIAARHGQHPQAFGSHLQPDWSLCLSSHPIWKAPSNWGFSAAQSAPGFLRA